MSRATITLDDDGGMIATELTFAGGFDPASHAHQHANLLIRMMDDICASKTGESITPADPASERVALISVE